jgi:Domain of unknown function (DUF4328)/Protein of unknown function (DUF2510)
VTAPSRAAADWYPDPLGRGEYRYWDGERWTQWIANGGVSRPDTFDLPEGLPEPSLLSTPPGDAPAPMSGPRPSERYDTLRFRTLGGLTTALTWLLGASAVSALALAAVCGNRISKISAFEDHRTLASLTDLNNADDTVTAMGSVLSLIMLAVLVVFIIYLFRASKNTELWDTGRRGWTPGWTIGAWFIPLANFVIPVLVVLDIWRRTPERSADGERHSTPSTSVVVVWWVLFLIGTIGIRLDVGYDTLGEYKTQDGIHIVGGIALAISAVILIRIVRDLARRQRATAFSDG